MLVSFSFANWRSYRNATTLSMVADRSRQHQETLATPAYYQGLRLLPTMAVYGGNAAGKSNLFDAIRFVQKFVTKGSQEAIEIPVHPFALNDNHDEPSSFSIQALVAQPNANDVFRPSRTTQQELIYQLDFQVNQSKILGESLSWYDSRRKRHPLYERDENGHVTFEKELEQNLSREQTTLLNAAAKGAGPRRLFITNTVDQQLDTFQPVYNWFKDVLQTADNGTEFSRSVQMMSDSTYCERCGKILKALGTGVESVQLESVPPDSYPIPLEVLKNFMAHVPENALMQMQAGNPSDVTRQIYVITKHKGDVEVRRVQTYRGGKPFGFENESSGTRRLLETLPIFMDLWNHAERTWVLDEMEREFHTKMTWQLLEGFLETGTAETRTQALLNTHDLMLMDQDLFRKDEIVIAERDEDGTSHLIPISAYEGIRNDLDLRRSYLDGRFGGMPSINLNAFEEAIHE